MTDPAAALEAAIRDAVECLEGDLFLHGLGSITTDTFFLAVRETKEKLASVLAAAGGAAS